jgi:hypothetical protein
MRAGARLATSHDQEASGFTPASVACDRHNTFRTTGRIASRTRSAHAPKSRPRRFSVAPLRGVV